MAHALRATARALQLTDGPGSPRPASGRNVNDVLVAQAQADVFITYCTNAAMARREEPALQVLPMPEAYIVLAPARAAVGHFRPRQHLAGPCPS